MRHSLQVISCIPTNSVRRTSLYQGSLQLMLSIQTELSKVGLAKRKCREPDATTAGGMGKNSSMELAVI